VVDTVNGFSSVHHPKVKEGAKRVGHTLCEAKILWLRFHEREVLFPTHLSVCISTFFYQLFNNKWVRVVGIITLTLTL